MPSLLFSIAALLSSAPAPSPAAAQSVDWQPWGPAAFARASAEHRFVLLDLQAVWCHWCHVMESETYADPKVASELAAHYVAVRVDQDSAPDLAARYGNWGWPATVVFAADGSEIVKRRGFIPPTPMLSLLRAIFADPTPGPSVFAEPEIQPSDGLLSASERRALLTAFDHAFDAVHGGWGDGYRLAQSDEIDLELSRALAGNQAARARVELTLAGLRQLIDPIWGGLYQYSDRADWSSPHYERLLAIQAIGLHIFAMAYGALRDPGDLAAALDIVRYLDSQLAAPGGGFYVSQDADLSASVDGHAYAKLDVAARRAAGSPRVDRHLYPRDNGLTIAALAELGRITGDEALLQRARRAAAALAPAADGSYAHGGQPALGDTVAMGEAALALFLADGDPAQLTRATAAAAALDSFADRRGAGFDAVRETTAVAAGALRLPYRDIDDNLRVARFCNLLARLTGDPATIARSERARRFVFSPQLRERGPSAAALLLADRDRREPPVHVVVVGDPADPKASALLAAARGLPISYLRVDSWRPDGPTPPDGPPAVSPAPLNVAYLCGPSFCSPPATTPDALRRAAERQLAHQRW